MPGLTDLATLLATLRPSLSDGLFAFVTLPGAAYGDGADLAPVAAADEAEGLTLVVPLGRAEAAGLAHDGVFRRITLRVPSSLHAVGLTAAVASALGERDVPANVIAAYHHDHLFVPADRAEEAVEVLERLAARHHEA